MALLRARDLVKTYQVGEVAVRALRGVTLDIDAGEFVAVVGPSGSGKSTFMHILGCLDRPTSGSYFLEDRDVSHLNDDALYLSHGVGLQLLGEFVETDEFGNEWPEIQGPIP